MNWKFAAVLLGFAITLGTGTKAYAENDQTVVIGLGAGLHFFSTTDNARSNFILAPDLAGMNEIFGEWYIFGEVGFGVRLISFGVMETVTTSGGSSEKELNVNNVIFTINWVPFGASGYTRMGLMAGAGPSDYEFTQTDTAGTSTTDSASGTAALAGIYVDWGGESFGARFGGNFISTDLGDINGAPADGSGTTIYFDLRWAF